MEYDIYYSTVHCYTMYCTKATNLRKVNPTLTADHVLRNHYELEPKPKPMLSQIWYPARPPNLYLSLSLYICVWISVKETNCMYHFLKIIVVLKWNSLCLSDNKWKINCKIMWRDVKVSWLFILFCGGTFYPVVTSPCSGFERSSNIYEK